MGFFKKLFGGGGRSEGGGGRFAEFFQTLQADLQLTPEQAAQMKDAFREFKQQKKEIKEGGGDRSKIRQEKDEMKQQLYNMLNDQQKSIFKTNADKYDELLKRNQGE